MGVLRRGVLAVAGLESTLQVAVNIAPSVRIGAQSPGITVSANVALSAASRRSSPINLGQLYRTRRPAAGTRGVHIDESLELTPGHDRRPEQRRRLPGHRPVPTLVYLLQPAGARAGPAQADVWEVTNHGTSWDPLGAGAIRMRHELLSLSVSTATGSASDSSGGTTARTGVSSCTTTSMGTSQDLGQHLAIDGGTPFGAPQEGSSPAARETRT